MPVDSLTPAEVYQASISLSMLNAVSRQQLDGIAASATTIMAATEILAGAVAVPPQLPPAKSASLDAALAPIATHAKQALDSASAADLAATALPAPSDDVASIAMAAVAQAYTIAVQDGANYLRNIQAIAVAAISFALKSMLSSPTANESLPLGTSKQVLDDALVQFQQLASLATVGLEKLHPPQQPGLPADSPSPRDAFPQSSMTDLATALRNAIVQQQNANITAQAATVMGVSTLYSLDSAAAGEAVREIPSPQPPSLAPDNSPTPN
jgi:hypothetical protein